MTGDMEFDYVIVGGGSAGATLAARLSEDRDVSVCLLEAGGEGKNLIIRLPIGAGLMVPGHPVPMHNWAFETIAQEELNSRRGYQPRGKALGGSSAINAMIYTRGHAKDYDAWAGMGCTGWGWDAVLPYFRKSEDNIRGADDFHGEGGPLQVADPQSPRPLSRAFVEAAVAAGLPRNADFNGPEQEGAGLFQLTQFHDRRRGQRCSAAAAFLHPVMTRANLEVVTHALGRRVIFSGKKATGVEFSQHGQIREVKARREVILCAGALQSPQLLMLSGIGNGHQLRAHGIDMVQEAPEVGLNLQDHIDTVLGYEVNTTDLFGVGLKGGWRLLKALHRWRKEGRGMASSNFAESGAFLSVGKGAEDWPDVQMHFVVGRLINHARTIKAGYAVTLHTCLLRPASRGWVRLATSDPTDAPMIDPGFLEGQGDAELLLAAVKKAREIMAAPPMAQHVIKDHDCGHVTNDADLMAVIREKSDTVYHPVGTCRMGGDEASVLDPQLRVRGVEGLRVVDASAMPQIISGNTNAPVIMMAEKAADMIKAARRA